MLGQGMKDETEKPTGHLPVAPPPIFKSGELGEGSCNYDMFIAGWFVVIPLDPPGLPVRFVESACHYGTFIAGRLIILPPVFPQSQLVLPRNEGDLIHAGWDPCTELAGQVEHGMDCTQNMGKLEAIKFYFGWESLSVPLADILYSHDHICDCEVGECVEATEGRHHRKLLRPSNDRHFAIGDFDATDERI